jgi:chemotaxis protein CheC
VKLNDRQTDALTELINIAFSRTASSLSQITGHRVLVEVPKLSIHPMDELSTILESLMGVDVATVHQIFTGSVSGDAFLVLNADGAKTLSSLLTDQQTRGKNLDTSAREVLTEVGNILLNACLGTFGNMLQMRIQFSVPRLHVHELGDMLTSLVIGKEEMRYALVITAQFKVRDSEVSGYLVIVLGVSSLDLLIREIEKLG